MKLSLRKQHWPFALDMGADSIKMLQMSQSGSAVRVSACGRFRFPESAADSRDRRKLAVEAVHDMLASGGFHGRRVVSVLPCSQLGIKNVRLPKMPEHELVQAVRWEARERFDFDVDDDQVSFINAGEVRSGTETREEIIMLAVSGEQIARHLELLSEMKLAPERVEAEPVAIFRAFERFLRRRADENAVSVIADVGAGATRVVVARGRRIVFVKSIDIGGRDLTQAVSKRLNLTYEEADDLRMRVMRDRGLRSPAAGDAGDRDGAGDDGRKDSLEWTMRDAMRPEVEAMAREISLCLRYCSVTFRGLRSNQLTVTGGEAYDPTLLGVFQEQLGFKCEIGHPLRGIDLSGVDLGGDRRGMLSEWAVCAGLAMSDQDIPDAIHEDGDVEHRFSA